VVVRDELKKMILTAKFQHLSCLQQEDGEKVKNEDSGKTYFADIPISNTTTGIRCNLETECSVYVMCAGTKVYEIHLCEVRTGKRSALFWDITQRRVVIVYRLFGTTYQSYLKKSRSPLKMGPIGCPETSVQNYRTTLLNIPEERRFRLRRCRSLKSLLTGKSLGAERTSCMKLLLGYICGTKT
jgi:hypothetical protein